MLIENFSEWNKWILPFTVHRTVDWVHALCAPLKSPLMSLLHLLCISYSDLLLPVLYNCTIIVEVSLLTWFCARFLRQSSDLNILEKYRTKSHFTYPRNMRISCQKICWNCGILSTRWIEKNFFWTWLVFFHVNPGIPPCLCDFLIRSQMAAVPCWTGQYCLITTSWLLVHKMHNSCTLLGFPAGWASRLDQHCWCRQVLKNRNYHWDCCRCEKPRPERETLAQLLFRMQKPRAAEQHIFRSGWSALGCR